MKDNTIKISRFLSLVLRHKPETIGVSLDEAGWLDIDTLIEQSSRIGKRFDRDILYHVVETNDKKRFEIDETGTRIRASQGHSINVDLGYEPMIPPDVLYHGTATKNLGSIFAKGLLKGQRHHVHLSEETKTALNVGQRYGKPVLLKVDAKQMVDDGIQFFRSTNGVWLTDSIDSKYLEQMEKSYYDLESC